MTAADSIVFDGDYPPHVVEDVTNRLKTDESLRQGAESPNGVLFVYESSSGTMTPGRAWVKRTEQP